LAQETLRRRRVADHQERTDLKGRLGRPYCLSPADARLTPRGFLLWRQEFDPDHPFLPPYDAARTLGMILIKNKVNKIPEDRTKDF
jgi:hypothetical protein